MAIMSTWPGGSFPVRRGVPRYEVETIEGSHYLGGSTIGWAEPSPELHLRELFDLNVEDTAEVGSFMAIHGWFAMIGSALTGDAFQVLGVTIPDLRERRSEVGARLRSDSPGTFRGFLLAEEVAAGVVSLRNAVRTWRELSSEQDWERLAAVWEDSPIDPPDSAPSACFYVEMSVNPGLKAVHASVRTTLPHAGQAPSGGGDAPYFLHNALSLMVYNDVDSGSPYSTCHNETCRRLFRHKEGGSRYGQFRGKGVLYCSESCQQAQKAREYRRRLKKRRQSDPGPSRKSGESSPPRKETP